MTQRNTVPLWTIMLIVLAVFQAGCDLFGTAVDERAPTVEINRPHDEALVSGKNVLISVSAQAQGEGNFVSFINININGERAGEAEYNGTNYNYRMNSFDYPDGIYRIEAVAFDKLQARGISTPILVTVENESSGPGPRMTIVDPEADDQVFGIIRVVSRTDPGEPYVTRVDLLVDGVPVQSKTDALGGDTYVFDWDSIDYPVGEHRIEVKAFSGPNVFRISDAVAISKTGEDDPEDGRPGSLKWRAFGFKGEVEGAVAVGFNNDIYVGTSSDTLYAFSPEGALKWKYATKGPIRSTPMIINNEDVVFTSEDGRLYGLSSQGERIWGSASNYNTGAGVRSTPAYGVDGTIYFGDSNGRLHAVDAFDGLGTGGNWPKKISDAAIVTPPVIARDRTVVVASTDGYVYALDPTGVQLWRTTQNIGSVMVGLSIVERDVTVTLPGGVTRTTTQTVVYAVSNSGNIYAIAGEDGSILWSHGLTGPLRSGSIVGPDGSVYVGTSTGLISLNEQADSYTARLRYILPASDVGTPVIDADGIVYFVAGKTLYAFNPNNTPYWEYQLDTEVDGPLTIARDGSLLLAGRNGVLYSFETGSVGLPEGKWPTFQRNARHSGRLGIDQDDG